MRTARGADGDAEAGVVKAHRRKRLTRLQAQRYMFEV